MLIKPKKKFWLPGIAPYYSAPAGVVFSCAWLTNAAEASGGSSVTYPSLNFGVADTNRILVVGVGVRINTGTITAVTIGGISATAVASTSAANATSSLTQLWQAPVPTGTTGSVVVTYSGATIRTGITLYRIVTATTTASSANNASTTGATTLAAAITIPTGGSGIAFSYETISTNSISWTNAVSDFSAVSGGSSQYSSATSSNTGSTTITATYGASNGATLSMAAWGP